MNKSISTYLSVLLLFFCTASFAQVFKLSLLTNTPALSAIFTPLAGDYKIWLDTLLVDAESTADVFQLTLAGDSIEVKSFEKPMRKCKKVLFECLINEGSFKLKSIIPEAKVKTYDDDLEVTVNQTGLKFVNIVDIEDYVAGVVESEAGPGSTLEYYKLQAILCRTYSLSNSRKHEIDSFNLCDQVHCQAYKGKTENAIILKAVTDTRGLVIVDESLNLISATFHSNCGGQTANSEDVWSLSATYLRGKTDTFCLQMPHARWKKVLSQKDWLSYLSTKFKYAINDTARYAKALSFSQSKGRLVFFDDKESKVPLKIIRADQQLKSTYFSITPQNDSLLFDGRGFGHGVGLCQEGAMYRAQLGASYKDIINFYYTNVHLVDLAVLSFLREE